MLKESPQVSIVMTAYNAERFLVEAMESILSQSFKDFEFLIMDDGSTDSTWEILQEYAKKDARIKLFQQENKGIAFSVNYLISQAEGELIARMDADDISCPDRLQKQVDYLIQHPEVGVSVTEHVLIAPNGLPYLYVCTPEDNQTLSDLFSKGINPIAQGSVIMRKQVLMALNEPPYRLIREREFEDADLWERLNQITIFSVIKEPLFFVRRYSGCVTNRCGQIKKDMTDTHFDYKVALLLKKEFTRNEDYEFFLNGRALFLNKHPIQAINHFIQVCFFGKKLKYRLASIAFTGLTLLGSLGRFIYRQIKNNPQLYKYYDSTIVYKHYEKSI